MNDTRYTAHIHSLLQPGEKIITGHSKKAISKSADWQNFIADMEPEYIVKMEAEYQEWLNPKLNRVTEL